MKELSIIIKTFERPNCLKRLLASIQKVCPEQHIIVIDDSRHPSLTPDELENYQLDIRYIKTTFNIGLSKGRNIGLQTVKTKYFLLLDDDFVLDPFSNIEEALYIIQSENLDILGGKVADINPDNDDIKIRAFMGYLKKVNNKLICTSLTHDSELIECDFVLNFFIGRTSAVKKVLWDEELHILEHLDFFYRAKKEGLSVAYFRKFFTFHQQEHASHYKKFRFNQHKKFSKLLHRKLDVKSILLENKKIYG